MAEVKDISVPDYYSLKQAMKTIDATGLGIAFVVGDDNAFQGVVTDGDIRRAILKGSNLEQRISGITNREPIVAQETWTREELEEYLLRNHEVRERMPEGGLLVVPVLGESRLVRGALCVSERGITNAVTTSQTGVRPVKKVLVIGGAGYLGSILCRTLLQRGYKVVALDNATRGKQGILELESRPGFKFIEGDMRDISTLVEGVEGVDAVIHLAGVVGDKASAEKPTKTLEVNYLATKMIIDSCKYFQINRVIFASTCSVYGASRSEDFLTEKSTINPLSLYAETKVKCEQSILDSVDSNFSPVILRMGTLFGYSPNMRFDLVVNLFTAQALVHGSIRVDGGNQWRPFLHVSDAAEAFIACLEAPIEQIHGEIYNVISENCRITDLGSLLTSFVPGLEAEVDEGRADPRNYRVSGTKFSSDVGFRPKVTLRQGILEMKSKIMAGEFRDYTNVIYKASSPLS